MNEQERIAASDRDYFTTHSTIYARTRVMTAAANYDSARVYYLSKPLRNAIRAARLESEKTVQQYFADVIAEQLPALTAALIELGMEPTIRTGPTKVAMETKTLKSLHSASAKSGVPQVQLAQCCLILATRGAKPKVTPKKARKPATKKATRKRATARK